MRGLVAGALLFALVVACNEHGKSPCPGGCSEAGVPDSQLGMCAATGGCPSGPVCGTTCCGSGERCVAGMCMCGMNKACTNGDSCQSGGPAGGDICGSICCGGMSPCPIAAN